MSFVYITDSGADLNPKYFKENGLVMPLGLEYTINSVTSDYIPEEDSEYIEFYDNMVKGVSPKTNMINPTILKERFVEFLKEGRDVLYLTLSSGISGTYGGACIAARELMEEYPERKVCIVDSLSASRGMGLLYHFGMLKMKEGAGIDEVVQYLEETRLRLVHDFTVDDLVYLQRGGRVSKIAAFAANTLNLKPIMHVDNDGKLVAYTKVKGRKKAIKSMIGNIEKQTKGMSGLTGYICHGNCLSEAEKAKEMMMELGVFQEVVIDFCGAVIGSHSGPGTLALFTLGKDRSVD